MEYEEADRELNVWYKKLREKIDRFSQSNLLAIQRKWIAYRDQTKSFKSDFPPSDIDEMNALMTNSRTRDLILLYGYIEDGNQSSLTGVSVDDAKALAEQLDADVEHLYKTVQNMSTYGIKNKVRKSHSDWLAYRDLDISFVQSFSEDSTLQLLLYYREKVALNQQRLIHLQDLEERLASMPPPPPPTPIEYINSIPLRISKVARDHIIKFETGGRAYFEKMYLRPQWPGYASGVTIGMGYDLGYHTKEQIREDWEGVASSKEIHAMLQVQGVTGSSAKYRASQIRNQVHINWDEAGEVFDGVTIPRWSRDTADAYRVSRGELHPDCNGALIGNTFNRGVGFSSEGKKREKWLIREAIKKGNYKAVPQLFRDQRKHWPGSGGTNGLQTRRSEEADLFQAGLNAMEENWPPAQYAADDQPVGDGRTWGRQDVVSKDHPIWESGEIHPSIVARKDRILGLSRSGLHYRKIRCGVLYAASASAHKAEALGYHLYVTSGNRWAVSSSPNHAQNGLIGDSIDFIITTKPGGAGARLPSTRDGRLDSYDILAAAIVAGANGIGWGRGNNAGHHVEVDDAQRGSPGYEDVWNYDDGDTAEFLQLEMDFARNRVQTNPKYAEYKGYYYGKLKPKPDPDAGPTDLSVR